MKWIKFSPYLIFLQIKQTCLVFFDLTYINSQVQFNPESESFTIEREIDGGVQNLEIPKRSILTCDLRLNTPRFPKLPAVLKAKKKPIETLNLSDFQSELDTIQNYLQVEKVEEPPVREGGVILESVDELLDRLRNVDRVL